MFNHDFANHRNRSIRDFRVQLLTEENVEQYKCLKAELSITSDYIFDGLFATSMASQNAGSFSFKFVDDIYSPFDGSRIEEKLSFNLKLTGLENITDKANAKVVVFVSYTATRSSDVQST